MGLSAALQLFQGPDIEDMNWHYDLFGLMGKSNSTANTSIWTTHIPNGPTKIHTNAVTARTNYALSGTDATFIGGVHAG